MNTSDTNGSSRERRAGLVKANLFSNQLPAFPTKALLLFSLALLAILANVAIDLALIDKGVLTPEHPAYGVVNVIKHLIFEQPPKFEHWYLAKLLLSIAASILLLSALITLAPTSHSRPERTELILRASKLTRAQLWALGGILFASGAFLLLFLLSPQLFFRIGSEDELIETSSAIMWFLSCGLFLDAGLSMSRSGIKRIFVCVPIAMALLCFLCAMEEVSWFQRVLSIPTPDALASNHQHEINLHNFFTNPSENAFYFAMFLFLIVSPFFLARTAFYENGHPWTLFVPGRFILLASAILVAYNYDMWNIIFTQLSFFMTLGILGYLCYESASRRATDSMFVVSCILLATVLLTQLVFLMDGKRFVRLYDVTEYKEGFIACSILLLSIDSRRKVKEWLVELGTRGELAKYQREAALAS